MKQMLIYERPLPLNRTRHRDLRIRPRTGNFAFAARLNSVPLVCGEFSLAARDYPIVFAGAPTGTCLPAALLGLLRNDNLFVGPSGQWAQGAHVPAFLRRYPFVVADSAKSDTEFTVCVDAPALADGNAQDAVRLFEQNGRDSQALEYAKRFLADYQGQVRRTHAFVKLLVEHELLLQKKIDVRRPDGTVQTLHGFCVVDETKLQALTGSALASLSESGALGLAYVHLMSLSNTQHLLARLEARQRTRPDC
ncbi:MAG: SapC family protein [Pseudomonadota bacterium]|nr:SapC family protein [Pseudomonadota bacterium]